jgi:hypothetical protein|tara:strand:+ start:12254 stop:13738 length:1485 start_codon:yes stop_codon:yes gene_type:complete
MSKPQVFQGQDTVRVANRWEMFVTSVRERAATLFMGQSLDARIRELEITKKLDVTGGHRFLTDVGQSDQTERQRVSAKGRMSNIEKLRRMYKGENDWGNQLVGNITDFNASMQYGQGVRVRPSRQWVERHKDEEGKADDPPEMEVWQDFIDFNSLSEEGGIDLGISGELDGQALMVWEPDQRAQNVRMWTVPLLETKYEVKYERLWEPSKAILYPGDQDKEKTIEGPEFVFCKLRGTSNGTYGIPTCARVVDEIINLDKASDDWRKINKLFASPTPVFKASGEDGIDRIWNEIKAINWKLGKAIILLSEDELDLLTLDPAAIETLLKEIIMRLQMISGATSIPVHFLGHPELMSNRAVAKEDMKPAVIHAGKAHKRWGGAFDELAGKVLPVFGKLHGQEYDASNIEHHFPAPASDVEGVIAAWLPARIAKQISHGTFLSKIGIDDPDQEIQKLTEELEASGVPGDDDEAQVAEQRVLEITERARQEAAQESEAA